MPRPFLPDNLPTVLADQRNTLSRLGGGTALLELGDPTGPPAITGLSLTSQVVTDVHGRDTAEVTAIWDAIVSDTSENADQSEAPVKDYLVSHSSDGGSSYSGETSTQANAAKISRLPVGRTLAVRVRARTTAGVTGPFTTAFITTAKDNGAPGAPSTPTLDNGDGFLKAVRVVWDGVIAGGTPTDLKHLEVWVGTENPPSSNEANFVGVMDKTERKYNHPTKNYDTHFAQLRAVDNSGNKSPFSGVSNGSKGEQVVNDDLAETVVVDARAQGTFGGGNGILNSSFESNAPTGSQDNGDGTATQTGGGPDPFRHWTQVVNATAQTDPQSFHKARHARLNRSGGSAALIASNLIPVSEDGEKVVSAWVRLAAAGLTPRVDLFCPNGTQPVLADQPTPPEYALDPNAVGKWQRIATAYKSATPGQGSQDLVARVVLDSGPNGTVDVDAVQYELGNYVTAYAPNVEEITPGSIGPTEIGPNSISSEKIIAGAIVAGKIQANVIGANEIRAGAITAAKAHLEDAVVVRAKIRDLAVDNAKIADAQITTLKVLEMSADRISTGVLNASTRIVAGNPSGNRVEIDYDGIRLLSGGAVRVALDTATGAGRFQGEISASTITGSTLRTGDTGNYIVLSDLSNRDKIQFVRADDNVNYVCGTITSVFEGIVIDGSGKGGGAGRIVLGSTNGDQIIAFARRYVRHDTHIRAGQVTVAMLRTGTDVAWPGGAFQNGVIPDAISVMVLDPLNGSGPVSINISNISGSGFKVWPAQGASRVDATRTLQIYAEALLFAPT